jgi:Tfx family DNA-binding protein
MVETADTALTERQVEVIELRQQGYTQKEVADMLGTTDANVSAIERAAEDNIEKARRTLELVRTIRAPSQFTVPSGTPFDTLLDRIYAKGDTADIKISHCRPELYTSLYGSLEEHVNDGQLDVSVEIGLTEDGDVQVFSSSP